MNFEIYLNEFKKSVSRLDQGILNRKNLEVSVGIVLDSVCLKLYKKNWTNNFADPLNAEARIFFSVWLGDKTVKEKKLCYNIHAFKLRKLTHHPVISKAFAADFRERFSKHDADWENVSVNFGPLTLMEGWVELEEENIENKVVELANKFIEIDYLVDDSLKSFGYIVPKI